MNLQQHIELIPADFDDNSKVWIYQSDRRFNNDESTKIMSLLNQFVSLWKSHGDPVNGFARLFYNQFIIIIADETATAVGGCSTDSSVHIIKMIESKYGVSLFDRQLLAFEINDEIKLLPLAQLKTAVVEGLVNADTLYFNNTITTKLELINEWVQPIKNSWLSGRLNFSTLAY